MIREVLLATAKPRIIAAVRRQARPETLGKLIAGSGVWELMKARSIVSTGHNVVVYWDEPGKDLMNSAAGIPIDVGAEVLEPFASDADLTCTATPAGRFVSALYRGPYGGLGEAYDAILTYCRQATLPLAGPYWEYYGHWNDDPAQLETTVNYLLK